MNAQQLGIMVQTQSEQIGRQHDTLIQEIGPLVQEVTRLLTVVKELEAKIPGTKIVQNTTTDAARDPPKQDTPKLVTKVDPKGK